MSIGTNLQFLRKQKEITQEQLAEQMDVSRQTISKWESDAAYPEMAKLLALCALFGCTLDTLVQGDAQQESAADTAGYDAWQNKFAAVITACIALLLLGITGAAFLSCRWPGERMNSIAGILVLLCVILALIPLVVAGQQNETFNKKHPQIQPFYTQKQIDAFETRYPVYLGAAIGCILVGLLLATMFSLVFQEMRWLAGPVFMLSMTMGAPLIVWRACKNKNMTLTNTIATTRPVLSSSENGRLSAHAAASLSCWQQPFTSC